MLFLHCSDLHIGKTLCERDLLQDQAWALDRIVEASEAARPDVFLVAGDVFDRSVPSPDAVKLFSSFLARIKDGPSSPEIVIVPGNHDSAARLGYCSEILASSRVHLRTDPEACGAPVTVERNGERCAIWAVPFLAAGAFDAEAPSGSGSAKTAGDGSPRGIGSQAELFVAAMSRVAPGRDPGMTDVLVCHVFAAGGSPSESERRFVGTAEFVDPSLFAAFDYAALGHLHARQKAGANGFYPGSPLAYSFSEADRPKSVSLVEVGKGSFSERPVVIEPRRRLRKIRGKFTEISAEPGDHGFADAYVEATLTDDAPVLGAVDALRRTYPFLLSVRQECMELAASAPSPALQPGKAAEAWSVGDDFRAFCRAVLGGDPDPGLQAMFDVLCEEAGRETA